MFFITNICGFVSNFNIPIIQHLNHHPPPQKKTDFLHTPAKYVQKVPNHVGGHSFFSLQFSLKEKDKERNIFFLNKKTSAPLVVEVNE